MVHGLEVPAPRAGARVERDQAVREQVVAAAVAAEEVELAAAGRHVDDAARGVHRHLGPGVGAADVGARVLRPGLGAELAFARDRPERPDVGAGADVEGADVAGGRRVLAVGGRAEDDQVLEDLAGQPALLLDGLRIAVEPFPQIHHAVLAEAGNGLAGAGVEGPQHVQRAEQQPAILAVGALPVVHAAHREALDLGRRPALRAGRRVEGDQRAAAGPRVDHVADDERIEVGVAVGIRPGDLQLRDVALGDLGGGDEPGAVRPAGIVAPFARRTARRRARSRPPRRRPTRLPSPRGCPSVAVLLVSLDVVHGPVPS